MDSPIPEIVNQMTFTAIVFNHAMMNGNVCQKCGKIYLPVMQGFDPAGFKFGMRLVEPPKEKSSIITDISNFKGNPC